MDSARARKKGRQKDDLSKLPITVDELKMRIRRRKGEISRRRPESGTEKSTTIRLRDFELLARFDHKDTWRFLTGRKEYGYKTLKRLADTILLIDSGRVTKSQYGVYHFHDEPVAAPVREMKISLSAGRIMGGIKETKTEGKMPLFKKLFGGM